MDQSAYAKGLATRRAVLGNEWVERSLKNANEFTREFQEMTAVHAWNDIWNRPGLPHKVRRMLVLAMTIAMGRWEEFRLHVRAGLESDMSVDELKEVLLQSAIYCGVPAANTAFKEANELVASHQARKPR